METNGTGKTEMTIKEEDREQAIRHRARLHAEARFSVLVHLVAYVSVNLLLAFINLLVFAGHWWVLWPVFGWGIGLFFHAVVAFLVPSIGRVRRRLYRQEIERMGGKADARASR